MPVVVEFESGLGNQLFQYAAGHTHAQKHGVRLIADSHRYTRQARPGCRVTWRPFILRDLGFPMEYRGNPSARLFGLRGFPRIYKAFRNFGLTEYRCPGKRTEAWNNLPADAYLGGYFQDLSYFPKDMKPVVEIVKERLGKAAKEHKVEPLPHNWGAAHVRLGDYLDTPEFYPDWFQKYSPSVVRELLEVHNCKKVMVFSDEPDKAAEMLKEFGDKVVFAESNFELEGALDLYRMSTATVLAIANSSFSCWAALLAHHTGSRIIAPRYWSEWCQDPDKLLYPEEWDVHGDNLEEEATKPQASK